MVLLPTRSSTASIALVSAIRLGRSGPSTSARTAPRLSGIRNCSRLRVVLASSADDREFAALRAALHADDAIDGYTSSADVERAKPAPDLVRTALEKARARPDDAVFVGDTVWDVQACGKAGVPCVGLESGGISRGELLDAGAAEVYEGPAELLAALPESILCPRR